MVGAVRRAEDKGGTWKGDVDCLASHKVLVEHLEGSVSFRWVSLIGADGRRRCKNGRGSLCLVGEGRPLGAGWQSVGKELVEAKVLEERGGERERERERLAQCGRERLIA